MADIRRPRRLGVDREHEHRVGREQEAVPDVWRDHRPPAQHQPHLRGSGRRVRLARHNFPLRRPLHGPRVHGLGPHHQDLDQDLSQVHPRDHQGQADGNVCAVLRPTTQGKAKVQVINITSGLKNPTIYIGNLERKFLNDIFLGENHINYTRTL